MKFKMEDLQALIKEQIDSVVSSTEIGDKFKAVMTDMLKEMQNNVNSPVPMAEHQVRQLVSSMPFARVDGNYITTDKGSIINLKNKTNPWVRLSTPLQEWVHDFAKYLKTGNVSKLLSESTDTAGGYLVPEEFRALMIMYDAEPTLMWQRATVWPMSGEKLSFPKLAQVPDVNDQAFDHFAGVSFAWTEEGGEKGETEPDFALLEMIVHELAGYTEVTNTLLDDSAINLMNYLTTLFRQAWYWQTDRSFFLGSGGKQPLGILSDPGVITVNRTDAGTVTVDDVLEMEASLPAVFDAGAVWFLTKKARSALRGQKVSESSNELVLQEMWSDITQGYTPMLLGRPVLLADGKIPALGSTGDVILGNCKWYYIGFRQDFMMDSSRHYKFRNNRTALRCSGRVDGQAAISSAFVKLGPTS